MFSGRFCSNRLKKHETFGQLVGLLQKNKLQIVFYCKKTKLFAEIFCFHPNLTAEKSWQPRHSDFPREI
jgi:hypothetical protein